MGAADAGCLGVTAIERVASGGLATEAEEAHLASCDSCAERLREAKEEAAFVARARTLTRAALGPEGSPRIPGYQTLGVLSSGAQGVVYRARQESTSRTVAIKTLASGEGTTARQRMRAEREAEIAARLRHPNIVTVFESRTLADGRIAVVMEYVDGVPLDEWRPPGATAQDRRLALLRVFIDVCRAIHHAHLNGVIHRDLKPDNILVTPEGRPVVLDFGIAAAPGIRTTQTGEFAGTPAYASPEQVSGKPDEVDGLTDVYSLGVILYRALCGAMPYELDGSLLEIARTIGEKEPVPPRRRDPGLPADLESIVLRALAKEKDRRYQSAAGFARDLERFIAGEPVEARSGSGWYLLRKAVMVNRRRVGAAAAALVMALAAAGTVAWSVRSAAEAAQREEFQRELARAEGIRARAVTELLREALPNDDLNQPEISWIIRSGLGKLYYKLEMGAFADDPDLDQALRRMWGSVYTDFGSGKSLVLVEYAEVAMRTGLTKLRMQHGAEHPEIAATLHDLASVTLVRQRVPEAIGFCREALAMREKLLGANAAETADSRALLAKLLIETGEMDEAIVHAERALAVFRALPNNEADLRIGAVTGLEAEAWVARSRPDMAEAPLREALVRRLRRLPPDDPGVRELLRAASVFADLAPSAAMTATLARAWGVEPSAAGAAIRDDVGRFRTPDVGDFCRPQASGQTRALIRLLNLQSELLGPDDPALISTLIATMRAADGEIMLPEKREAALRAAAIIRKTRGELDRAVLPCIEEAAVVLGYEGRPDEAVELTRWAQRIHELPPRELWDVLIVSNSRRFLGWFLSLAGRDEEAAREYRTALEALIPELGEEHHVVAMVRAGLAASLARLGEMDEAEALSAAAIDAAYRSPNIVGDQMSHICFARGRVLLGQGRFEEAARCFKEAWDRFYYCTATTYPWRIETLRGLARCARERGDAAAAEEWERRQTESRGGR